jgi:gamma-butyrobetaine dioxygenase
MLTKSEKQGHVLTGSEHQKTDGYRLWLRDACQCNLCVDPSTKQKVFETSKIPANISYKSTKDSGDGKSISVTWDNDIPGFGPEHTSTYEKSELELYDKTPMAIDRLQANEADSYKIWNRDQISERIQFIDHEKSMTDEKTLFEVLEQLKLYGLVFINNVPGENGPAAMGKRIGSLRDTFYGETWDVKSVPQAKNVAYTHRFLGFHMDLLYMADPPGFQLLHCIKNSCEGGESMFMDSFYAVNQLQSSQPTETRLLADFPVNYHYKNAGEHYRHSHNTVIFDTSHDTNKGRSIKYVNYSPPFQAPFNLKNGTSDNTSLTRLTQYHDIVRQFQNITESEDNIYKYKMKEGEMVIFNNRRVLHARTAFDVSSGERWLKGGYIDTDVVLSKHRVLREQFSQ